MARYPCGSRCANRCGCTPSPPAARALFVDAAPVEETAAARGTGDGQADAELPEHIERTD